MAAFLTLVLPLVLLVHTAAADQTVVACSSTTAYQVPNMAACQCPEEAPAGGCKVAVACTGSDSCSRTTLDAREVHGDFELTCSGEHACYELTVECPPAPHACSVRCTGSGSYTCVGIDVRGAKSASVEFECETSSYGCGYIAKLTCPASRGRVIPRARILLCSKNAISGIPEIIDRFVSYEKRQGLEVHALINNP